MIVLTNGHKKPQTGDFGDIWFPALEDNIDLDDSHNHNGSNSETLAANAVSITTQVVSSGDFSLVSGRFRATVTIVNGEVDKQHISFRDATSRDTIYLETEYINATSIYVYSNTARDFTMVLS